MRVFPWLVFVVLLACAAPAAAQSLRVSVDRTSLRDRPATDGAMVVTVEKGVDLQLLERAGAWFRVRVTATGAEGYVHSLMVENVGAASAPAASVAPVAPAPVAPPIAASTTQAPAAGAGGGRLGLAIKGGLTQASIFGSDINSDFGAVARRTGLTAGLALGVPIGSALSIQPEALLTHKGTRNPDDVDEALIIRYLEIPVLVRLTFGEGSTSPFVYAGPAFALKLKATATDSDSGRNLEEEDISDEIAGTDLGLVFGGGVSFGRLTAEARLTRGTRSIDANLTKRSAGPVDIKNTALSLLVGFSFGSP